MRKLSLLVLALSAPAAWANLSTFNGTYSLQSQTSSGCPHNVRFTDASSDRSDVSMRFERDGLSLNYSSSGGMVARMAMRGMAGFSARWTDAGLDVRENDSRLGQRTLWRVRGRSLEVYSGASARPQNLLCTYSKVEGVGASQPLPQNGPMGAMLWTQNVREPAFPSTREFRSWVAGEPAALALANACDTESRAVIRAIIEERKNSNEPLPPACRQLLVQWENRGSEPAPIHQPEPEAQASEGAAAVAREPVLARGVVSRFPPRDAEWDAFVAAHPEGAELRRSCTREMMGMASVSDTTLAPEPCQQFFALWESR